MSVNPFQDLFDRQKRHFATGATRRRGWRIEQLDRMRRLLAENEAALQQAIGRDFKTASQEQIFETLACFGEVEFQKSQLEEWMKPVEAPVPRALAATGHRGVVYRDPYGVVLVVGPFNGPLLLLLRPAITALAAGNTCVLKLSERLSATSALLLDLVPKYFEPHAVAAVAGHREETTELLKLPFDFIFFTGSTSTGKVVARAARRRGENRANRALRRPPEIQFRLFACYQRTRGYPPCRFDRSGEGGHRRSSRSRGPLPRSD